MLMRQMAGVAALAMCVGCASMNGDQGTVSTGGQQPVGTTGTRSPNTPEEANASQRGTVPVGQELDVRLQTALNSGTATAEQRFEATTAVDLMQDGRVLIPAGSQVRGLVSSVESAGRVDRAGRLTLAFDRLTVNGRDYEMRALATQVYQSQGIRDEVGTVGAGAGVGAIVGGIIGGMKGALIGAIVGGGGVVAATEGKEIDLPSGTIVRLRLDTPVRIR